MACSQPWLSISGVSPAAAALTLATLVALSVFVTAPAQAQTFTILHSFTNRGDGGFPYAGVNLIVGDLYGTTSFTAPCLLKGQTIMVWFSS